jgi:Fe-Mn family superoxide dismutase
MLTANYGFTDARFTSHNLGDGTDYTDNRVPFVPRHTFTAAADFSQKVSGERFVRSAGGGMAVNSAGNIVWDEANSFSQPFHATLDAYLAVQLAGNIGLKIWWRNLTDTRYATLSLEEIVRQSDGAIFNNAAQALNHVLFFEQFSPSARHHPEGKLLRAIDTQFGSLEELKKSMVATAVSLFGSGWVWLAADNDGVLYVIAKANAGTPLTDGLHPLIALDVWEHAYYLDYRNMRKDSVTDCFKVIDWAKVEQRYNAISR